MMSIIAVPYQDNECDCGVFVCRYAYNLYMMRHQKFTYCDYFESPPFTSKITRGLVFQFDVSDIDRIREEIATLINNLSKLYLVSRFVMDEEKRTESISPHLEASLYKGTRKLLKMSVTVKWGIPSICQATQIHNVDDEQTLYRERHGRVKVVSEATKSDAFRRQKSPRLSHVLFARYVDEAEVVSEGAAKASKPHKSLNMLDEIITVEQSRYIVPPFVSDEEKRTESLSPQFEALDSVVGDQALCREKYGRVEVVSEVTNPVASRVASRRQKSPRLSYDVPARNVDAVELVSEGTAKAARPHKSLDIPEEIVTVDQSRYIVPQLVMDEEKRTESISPHLEASLYKGTRKLLKMSVTVKWGIPVKLDEKLTDSVGDDQALCRESNGVPAEVLSEVTISDASSGRKSPRLSHFRVGELIFAWDKGHLYEATVSRWRDAKDGGMEYFVRYLGYGKRHDKWLATKDMMKCTPATREFYNNCTSWPLNAVDKSSSNGEGKVEGDLDEAYAEKEGNGRFMMPSSFKEKENISQERGSQTCVFDASTTVVAGDRVAVPPPPVAGGAVASSPERTREAWASPPTPAPQSSTTTIVSLADFARDVIARTEGGFLIASTAREVEQLCGFLVAKYAVADISIPARMSPPATVDAVWHSLMLYPLAYDAACRRAYELAASVVAAAASDEDDDDFAYEEFPGVVDHSPNAASDPPSAKAQQRRAAVLEMYRLGLSSLTTADLSRPASQSRANVCLPPAAQSIKRARLTNGRGFGRNPAEEDAEKDEAAEAAKNWDACLSMHKTQTIRDAHQNHC